MTEHSLKTATDVFDALRLNRADLFGEEPVSRWVFRGHRNRDWRLTPGVWRDDFLERFSVPPEVSFDGLRPPMGLRGLEWDTGDNADWQKRRDEIIDRCTVAFQLWRNFAVLAEDALIVELATGSRTLLDHLANLSRSLRFTPGNEVALAQHYGIPTVLLDFSSDPLTALFFALPLSIDDAASGTIWAVLAQDTPGEGFKPSVKWKRMATSLWDKRMSAQRSVFSHIENGELAYMKTGKYPAVDELLPAQSIHKFHLDLPPDEVRKLTIGLLRERRSQAHLMPDLGAAGEVGTTLYKLDVRL